MGSHKILVVGPVQCLEDCVPKLSKINAKNGPFELCLLLRPPSSVPKGWIQVPTYFVSDSFCNDSNPRLISPDINYKGNHFSDSAHGLRLIMCADDEGATAITNALEKEGADFMGVDVMVTHCGPKKEAGGSEVISRLGKTARPRYHFFGGDAFHAFDPFQGAGSNYVTRVLSIGQSGRWVYAADVTPIQAMSEEERRKTVGQRLGTDMYICGRFKRHGERNFDKRQAQMQKRARRDCWFCLSNEVEQHLVVAVGENVYVALAKGGVNDSHLVIVPVAHISGSTSEQASMELISEVEMYMKAIRRYYKEQKNSETMIFEWCGEAEMMHMCVQTIAIRKEACGRLAEVCTDSAKRFGVEVKLEDGLDGLREARRSGGRACFWAEIPGEKRIVAKFEGKKKLPANFGRVVTARTLGVLDRIEWRKCIISKTAEESLAEKVDDELKRFLDNNGADDDDGDEEE